MKKKVLALVLALAVCMGLMAAPASALNAGEEWVGDFVVRDGKTLVKYYGEESAVTIPSGIVEIERFAFQDCASMTSVTIPNSVTKIGQAAFVNCTGLKSVTIPGSVTKIDDSAFHNCTSLTSATISDGATMIGPQMFSYCTALTSVTIPNSVTTVQSSAFANCTSLTSVTIPDSATYIELGVFRGCTSLTSVVLPGSIKADYVYGDEWFYGCTALTSVTLPGNMTRIGKGMFYGCTSLTSVVIPDSVFTIKDEICYNCTSLKSVTIPDSVSTIGSYSFENCSSLTDVYYAGGANHWKAISISPHNDPLLNAAFHYNSTGAAAASTMPGTTPAPTGTGFADVKTTDFYARPVAWAIEKNITKGTGGGNFSPNKTCTQGEILTFLWRALGEPAPKGAVTGTQFYAKAAQVAKELGLTDSFSADAPCTRAMVVTYLWRLDGSPDAGKADFTDVSADAGYAQAVAWAVQNGITKGTGDGKFSPDKTCTRGEIVTFLYRALGEK